VVGPPCISCLPAIGDAGIGASISSILTTDCPSVASAVLCSAECSSVTSAVSACSSKGQCLCPTLSVVGPSCIACLSSYDSAAASTLSSYLGTVCKLLPTVEVCSAECEKVISAASICSNAQCLCPSLSVIGPPCISCISNLGDVSDAATISSFLATDCQVALSTLTPTPTVTVTHNLSPTLPPSTTSLVLVTSPTIAGSTTGVQSKSGSRALVGEIFGAGFLHIMLGAITAGVLVVIL
jgi:hypothetical protein